MKWLIYLFVFLISGLGLAQKTKAEDFGFRQLKIIFKGDTVNLLIKSKKGEEQKRKPIFLFCQGSMPRPLIVTDGDKTYSVFPFKTDSLEKDYHLIIIKKPGVPLIEAANTLGENFMYLDPQTGKIPKAYSSRNLLDYYVERNLKVLDELEKLPFVDRSKLVVAGHSEGSTIAAKMGTKSKKITHLIYASGNPFGRIMSMIGQDRNTESDADSARFAEYELDYWKEVVGDKSNLDDSNGDTYKATYDFSIPPIQYLKKLKIPVLVCYGTKDWSCPFNDYLRVEMLRQNKINFTYKAYIGLEHNFFPLTPEGKINYDVFGWDKVANDWQSWLEQH